MRPVEAGALHHQHFFRLQHLEDELLVVHDRIHGRIEAREEIQRGLGLETGHPGNLCQQLVREVALAQQAPARPDQVVDALVAAQRRLHGELPGHVGAQAHGGEDVQAFEVILRMPLVAGNDHPAGAVSTRPVVF